MKFKLRPYQTESVNLLRDVIIKSESRSIPILCLPTGAGKTVTFSSIAEAAQRKHKRVGIVCHRTELVEQARSTLIAYGLNPLLLTFGMVQTYARSPHKIPEMDVCIIDECHIGNFRKFIDLLPDSVQVIGATATPVSSSNKNPLNKTFTDVVAPVQILELIKDGFLSKPVYNIWKIDSGQLKKLGGEFTSESQARVFSTDNLIEAVKRRTGKTIIFVSSIGAVLNTVDIITEHAPDSVVFHVHSKMKDKERSGIIAEYKQTSNSIIVNCGILTAGFDEPAIETVIVYRATTSVALWLQMCGRGSRIFGNIDTFKIMDLGGNVERLLAWEANRNWSEIFKLQGLKLKSGEAPMKKCVNCEAVIYAVSKDCPYCGKEQPVNTKPLAIANKIEIIQSYSDLPTHLNKAYSDMTVTELIERASYGSPNTGRPFKIGWIVGILKKNPNFNTLIFELAELKGYSKGWVFQQKKLLTKYR